MSLTFASPTESRVNTTTLNDQSAPVIARLALGYVVVWQSLQTPADYSNSHFPAGYDIYMQRYDDDGVPIGSEVRVNTVTFNDQVQPAVTATADGGFVIAWASAREQAVVNYDYGIYLQQFDAEAAAVGAETHVNNYYFLDQQRPDVAALAGGGFVVTFVSDAQSVYAPGIYAVRFAADGTALGSEVRIDVTTANAHSSPVVAGLADGGYVIAWDGMGGIYTQQFDADGTARGASERADDGAFSAARPALAALADGGYVVAWQADGGDGSGSAIMLQRFGADGAALGGDQRVNTFVAGDQTAPAAAALADGGFMIGWDSSGQDGSGSGLYAQHFDAGGQAVEGEVRINATVASDQTDLSLAGGRDGGLLAAWTSLGQDGSGGGIYAGEAVAAQFPAASGALAPSLWQAGALLWAGFGVAPEPDMLAEWAAKAEITADFAALAQEMTDHYAPGVASADLVAHLYRNLVHESPSTEVVQGFVDQIGPGRTFTGQGELFAYAASLPLNLDAIVELLGNVLPPDPAWF